MQPFFIFCLIFFLPITEYKGTVVKVIDGDTIDILEGRTKRRVRLYGIDAPEKGQPYNDKAREYLALLVAGKKVKVISKNKDRYGRIVGNIYLLDGTHVNATLLKAGYAWHFKRYAKEESFAQFEQQARKAKAGLWKETNPMAPWEFRKQKKLKKATTKKNVTVVLH